MASPRVDGSLELLSRFGFAACCLPAEQFHEVLEAILADEIERARRGALGCSQVDEEQHQQDDKQQRDQQVPAGRQDVVPLGLVRTLLGELQVSLRLLIPGLHRCIQGHKLRA